MTTHTYTTNLVWEGSTGVGYRTYSRSHRANAAPAARNHIEVVNYTDEARGFMSENVLPISINRIELSPFVSVATGTNHDLVRLLTEKAHEECYISNSLKSIVLINVSVVDA